MNRKIMAKQATRCLLLDVGTGLFVKHNLDYEGPSGDCAFSRQRYYSDYGPHEAAIVTEGEANRLIKRRFFGYEKVEFEAWNEKRKAELAARTQ